MLYYSLNQQIHMQDTQSYSSLTLQSVSMSYHYLQIANMTSTVKKTAKIDIYCNTNISDD